MTSWRRPGRFPPGLRRRSRWTRSRTSSPPSWRPRQRNHRPSDRAGREAGSRAWKVIHSGTPRVSSAAAVNSVEEVKHWEMGSEVPVSEGAGVPQVAEWAPLWWTFWRALAVGDCRGHLGQRGGHGHSPGARDRRPARGGHWAGACLRPSPGRRGPIARRDERIRGRGRSCGDPGDRDPEVPTG